MPSSILAANPGHAGYLQRDLTWQRVYRVLAQQPAPRALAERSAAYQQTVTDRHRRALLIGINNYPDPASRLDGCVNDVFLMSSVLQEIGFDPEDIRVVLDERATGAAIRERIDWLLEGTADGQERVLFYSGHGAQLPDYNPAEVVDHVDECLVPYDFHWTQESAITDDDFLRYLQRVALQREVLRHLRLLSLGRLDAKRLAKNPSHRSARRHPAPDAPLEQGGANVGGASNSGPES